jgi:hypothetical protein
MKWLQGTYTQRFNSRHKEWGHLFQGRYKAIVIQSDQGDYFPTVATYIHLNPVRARLLDFKKRALSEYQWSSFHLYYDPPKRPDWLCVDRVLGSYHLLDDKMGLEDFAEMMKKRTLEVLCRDNPMECDERWRQIRRGWCLGDKDFREKMNGAADERICQFDRRSYLGAEASKHDEFEAQRLLSFGLKALGITSDDLPSLRKNDSRKKVIAWLIRRNTSVMNDWICSKLSMGRASNLSRHVRDVEESDVQAVINMREMMKKAF